MKQGKLVIIMKMEGVPICKKTRKQENNLVQNLPMKIGSLSLTTIIGFQCNL